MKNSFRTILLISAISVTSPLMSGQAGPDGVALRRDFRPVAASAVRLEPRSGTDASVATAPLATAWAAFDRKDWLSASEWFLSALSADPESEAAAEGLVMSLYHNGDYFSAGLLAAELGRVMPRVPLVLGGVVGADVRGMVMISRIGEAKTLLGFFPESEPAFEESHRFVKEAEGLAVTMLEGE